MWPGQKKPKKLRQELTEIEYPCPRCNESSRQTTGEAGQTPGRPLLRSQFTARHCSQCKRLWFRIDDRVLFSVALTANRLRIACLVATMALLAYEIFWAMPRNESLFEFWHMAESRFFWHIEVMGFLLCGVALGKRVRAEYEPERLPALNQPLVETCRPLLTCVFILLSGYCLFYLLRAPVYHFQYGLELYRVGLASRWITNNVLFLLPVSGLCVICIWFTRWYQLGNDTRMSLVDQQRHAGAADGMRSVSWVERACAPPAMFQVRAETTAFVVWGVWAAMTLAAFVLVVELGPTVPFYDELGVIVPLYTGDQPVNFQSLWERAVNHRVFFPKIILVTLDHISGHDFRAGMFMNVILLSALSVLMIATAKHVRGRLSWTDSMFPALLLNWGHSWNLLWSVQLSVILPIVLACVVLALIVKAGSTPSLAMTVLAVAILAALPLCQAAGLALAPPLALWLVAVGLTNPAPSRLRKWGFGLAMLAACVAVVVIAAKAYIPPLDYYPAAKWTREVIWNCCQFLCISFSNCPKTRFQQLHPFLPTVMSGFLLVSTLLLWQVWRRKPAERLRAFGLLVFLAAVAGLGIGIAWGRHGDPMAFRYPIMAAPILCGLYFIWTLYGQRYDRTFVCAMLCLVVFAFCPLRSERGLSWAIERAQKIGAFEADVRAGFPIDRVVDDYVGIIYPDAETFSARLTSLRDAEIGVFRNLGKRKVPDVELGESP